MSTPVFRRVTTALGATIIVLIATGVAMASDRGDQRAEPRPPVTTPVTTVATAPSTPPPTTSAPGTPSVKPLQVATPPEPVAPSTTPVTLSYEPFHPTPPTAAPPTTARTSTGYGGCHESLVPIPECGVGPFVTEPPP